MHQLLDSPNYPYDWWWAQNFDRKNSSSLGNNFDSFMELKVDNLEWGRCSFCKEISEYRKIILSLDGLNEIFLVSLLVDWFYEWNGLGDYFLYSKSVGSWVNEKSWSFCSLCWLSNCALICAKLQKSQDHFFLHYMDYSPIFLNF